MANRWRRLNPFKEDRLKARVTVYPRPEILDPQGKAIRDAVARIGYTQISDLRAGKSFDLSVEATDPAACRRLLTELCERVLANPLLESYTLEIEGEGARP